MGIAWTPDGTEIVLSMVGGGSHLTPVAGGDARRLACSRCESTRLPLPCSRWPCPREPCSRRLHGWPDGWCTRSSSTESDIWQIVDGVQGRHAVSSTRDEFGPQLSPDGRRIAFYSNRSGTFQVWIADVGSGVASQLTFDRAAGHPRWAPDGVSLVFQREDGSGHVDIYQVAAGGGPLRRLTEAPSDEVVPSFSRDGRHIYFSSNRTGRFEVFRMNGDGRDAKQMTTSGGDFAVESPDAKWLIYQKPRAGTVASDIWQMPATGGKERRLPVNAPLGAFAVAPGGIYFVPWEGYDNRLTQLSFYDFATRRTRVVMTIEGRVEDLVVAPRGPTFLFTRLEREQSDLMLANGFR